MREIEVAGLDINSVFLDSDFPYVEVIGKGAYEEDESRIVYLTGEATRAIREWIEVRNEFDGSENINALFFTREGKRLVEDGIISLFKNNSNGITPHMMRHWYSSVARLKLGDVGVQHQLGHTSVNTTSNNYIDWKYGMKDVLASM